MGVWDEPHSARGMRQHDADDRTNDGNEQRGEPRPGHDTPHGLLYLTPTTIAAPQRLASVVATYAATDADGGLVWRCLCQPQDTARVEERVVVEYRRAVGQPCSVRVGMLLRVPPSATP